ncbi:hypothetical protein TrST_g5878 [Triparma strigata]|uniref:Uncharacterized protein n=1 Tax=Triparma strigata TaxID=1606541 RepID=A0A9W7BBH3_9STRA|nr:hypothetical protein TrST_g5878 [Triparma strigata]
MSSEPAKKQRKIKITFDEEGIAEHDLTRGTRQKIDEPDTPYTSYIDPETGVDSTSLPSITLPPSSLPSAPLNSSSLNFTEPTPEPTESNRHSDLSQLSSRLSSLESQVNEEGTITPKKDFKDVRSKHYNEFEMLKKFRESMQDEDDDEDDEE